MDQNTGNNQRADPASIKGRSGNDFYTTLSLTGQYADAILIGDTDHTDLNTRTMLSSEPLIKSLAESGIHHLCIELPKEYQPLVDEYQQGKISRDKFKDGFPDFIIVNQGEVTKEDYLNSIVSTLDNTNKYGIKVHAVDGIGNMNAFLSKESQAVLDRVSNAYKEQTGINSFSSPEELRTFNQYANEHKLWSAKEIDKIEQEWFEARFNDSELHENIIAATNGEKTAVIFGNWHDDLTRRLRESGVSPLVVDIYSGRALFEDNQKRDVTGRKLGGEPDIVHFLNTGQTYTTDKIDHGFVQDLYITPGTLETFEPAVPAAPALPAQTQPRA